MSAIVELKSIKKVFYTEEMETHALSDICFTINKGEYISISGPSGCGKSTLLSILGLLDKPSEGEYKINGIDVGHLNAKQQAVIRNQEIGFVFQSFNLISDLTVEENVMLPLTYRKGMHKKEMKSMAQAALEKVDMKHRGKHFPAQLSGGQQQRVAVARAIVGNPTLVLADEPTGNLDSKNADAVIALFDQLHQTGSTICMVTHDARSAARALRQIEIFDGMVIDDRLLRNSMCLA
ncbi:ABC transporter ATP-binding protein [Pectobacteriaceae bacterium CE70]|uniref:ABC transporter ATP-binding protein n=1 Tax=Serratia sp. (strain ATCC 39006) TaxID=104623 RepID=A0A2I5T9I9_SERS3|nr:MULTISPECIES: ABC transporter ATP-binding protein [Enterobacterales]WJV64147.1 ABC transporter ATP-binding protein [Pectobacteriaceae bacterium C52]WJV65420.1 ABC transporter ATP-binding protein [Pectobacteriaceae bacterium CE70]WJY09438.1 ABC transporter ATP-binding protein [Pectobacteriaceae bacterium C80]AUH01233.1 ABC transporter ATP-binding protein [Serratia sp. ATCC 39006]AUH05554.1 ABC transporter ATP-binding protein [Serratia sp. ATCC 39006]